MLLMVFRHSDMRGVAEGLSLLPVKTKLFDGLNSAVYLSSI
jgi:hypothetical protein